MSSCARRTRTVGTIGWNVGEGSHRRVEEGAGGPTAAILRTEGSAGGPETRMKKYRGTQLGSTNGRGSESRTSPGSRRHHLISKAKTRRRKGTGGPTSVLPLLSSRGWGTRWPSPILGGPRRLPSASPAVGAFMDRDAPTMCPREPSAGCAIEQVFDRGCVPSAAARSKDAAPVELFGDPMQACRSFAADDLD
jgi:hypothetical protein